MSYLLFEIRIVGWAKARASRRAHHQQCVTRRWWARSALPHPTGHLPPSGPITRFGRYVEISGTKHSTTTASIISSTNGSVPQITSLKGMSGATLRMTKIFKPTGGGIQSHLHHDGHDDAEPDDVEIGGAQRRQDDRRGHQDDRHRRQKKPEHDDHD